MKTIANWFLLGIFALQTTGVVRFVHLMQLDPGTNACIECQHCHGACSHAFVSTGHGVLPHNPATPGPRIPHRHDPQKCKICRMLATPAASPPAPPAIPAVTGLVFELPAPPARPGFETLRSALDVRGPPAATL